MTTRARIDRLRKVVFDAVEGTYGELSLADVAAALALIEAWEDALRLMNQGKHDPFSISDKDNFRIASGRALALLDE